ncbi:MAG TPA: response regulator [Verrucomicrobiae bacterium]|nr:response regulator [Verrucomicrobiae bacterium]
MSTTMLIADDDNALPLLLEHAIEKSGHDVSLKWVPDGDVAIQYLSRQGDYADVEKYPFPSVLLLDLKMPRVTGFEVLEWKRTQPQLETLPVVIWSSSDLPEDKERARRLGATSYFVKPMETGGFMELLAYLKQFHQDFRRPIQTVKLVIRNLTDGTFYRSPGTWVASAREATEVNSVGAALELFKSQALENLELLAISQDGCFCGGHHLLKLAQHHQANNL